MNKINTPVPHPEYPEDYAKTIMTTMQNQDLFAKEVTYFPFIKINWKCFFFSNYIIFNFFYLGSRIFLVTFKSPEHIVPFFIDGYNQIRFLGLQIQQSFE